MLIDRPERLMHRELLKPMTNVQEVKMRPCLFSGMGVVEEAKKLQTVVGRLARVADSDLKYRGNIPVVRPPRSMRLDLQPLDEMVVHLRVYLPFRHSRGDRELPRFSHEVVALGQHTLAHVRDVVECRSDDVVCREVSTTPFGADQSLKKAKAIYRSGFFYIESVFYNDGRHPSSHDISAQTREWALERGLPRMATARMESTRLCDLSVRLGYPYVYVHQGDCEHLVVFSVARLLHSDDNLCSAAYPFVAHVGHIKERYCNICNSHVAKWVTVDNEHCPYNPGYFCESCFFSFNYVDSQKVCDFRAYCIRSVCPPAK
ncbi:snRNA-activating protein complex subunit 3 isoform X2 [Bacillus rossius redtenbacheri]|uniref:snRNA-activating protein complex subunit 3 isoform X2 n=1 Tax=Bacillus rossius redtenbacheri TaxID=93214 RepID=UPI002FDE7A1E